MLSEELGLQKLLEGREGRPCSGSVRQFVPPTWPYIIHVSNMRKVSNDVSNVSYMRKVSNDVSNV